MKLNIEFPIIEEYDLTKAGEIALYHAHCDLYPFKGLIETTKEAINATSNRYQMDAIMADDFGDMYSVCKAQENKGLYMSRVAPLAYSSIVLMMVSLLEEAFNTACRSYQIINNYAVELKDISGQGLERAILYLEKVAGVKGIKSDPQWEYIKTIRDARNMIVHNGGRINGDIAKFEKFGFYIREEDKQLLFEYDILIQMYDGIIEFIDRTFKIEPDYNQTKCINNNIRKEAE